MKILVPVKRVVDYTVKIRIKSDGSGVDTQNVKMSMNPFDEIALEQAVLLKEAGIVQEVMAVTIGPTFNQDILRSAFARGADRTLLVTTEQQLSPLTVARTLAKLVEREKPQLVFLGKQAIDSDNQQVGQMLAGLLDWPQATYASQVTLTQSSIQVTREVDTGVEILDLQLPAVITADLRLNEPRYLSLPNIMQAKQKTIEQIAFEDLGVTVQTSLHIQKTFAPAARKAGTFVPDVATLVDKLHNEAKVI